MDVLLFDMDGVLLEARAYHLALREVVERIGRALGFHQVGLTQEDVHYFESVGVTSEWDSSAICHALLLDRIWEYDPESILPTEPPLPEVETYDLAPPDFRTFFNLLPSATSAVVPSLMDAERLLLQRGEHSPTQIEALQQILRNARGIQSSLTHRLFQELILGSRMFRELYGLEASISSDGYLLTLDLPTLDEDQTHRLRAWLAQKDHCAAVFTNRPSKPPCGFFDTPEAELGMMLVGLEGIPIIGHGGLAWMTERRGLQMDALLKPSPVHALAALRIAMGDPLELALQSAVSLALEGMEEAGWDALDRARVVVFEDATKGLQSACAAQGTLRQVGVSIDLQLRGVSPNPEKAKSLEAAGAHVFDDLATALGTIIPE